MEKASSAFSPVQDTSRCPVSASAPAYAAAHGAQVAGGQALYVSATGTALYAYGWHNANQWRKGGACGMVCGRQEGVFVAQHCVVRGAYIAVGTCCGVAAEGWFEEVEKYEKEVLSKRI